MSQNKRNELSFATVIICEISAIIDFWSVKKKKSARLPTSQEDKCHKTALSYMF